MDNTVAKIWNDFEREVTSKKNASEVELRYKLITTIEKAIETLGGETVYYDIYYDIEKRTRNNGFADIIINGILIETKRYDFLKTAANKRQSIAQTLGYMKSEGLKHGIIIDFAKALFIEINNDGSVIELEKELSLKTFIEIIGLLTDKNRKRFISEIELIHDFSPKREPVKSLIKHLYELLEKGINNKNSKVRLLFDEWEKLFKLSGEIRSNRQYEESRNKALSKRTNISFAKGKEYFVLFSLHTALSIILKTIIASIISKLMNLKVSDDIREFYKLVESGELFRNAGIKNFCNYDFFSWYLELDWNEEFLKVLEEIRSIAELYEHLRDREVKDVLQELYFEFIPREIRHSFGEYYTPAFIADYMVEEVGKVIDRNDFTAIDPTCGSGTFLMSLIKYKKRQGINLDVIARQVFGIDLNPTAVLMAKFNYLNALFDIFAYGDRNIQKIEIPVYIGDSSYTPNKEVIDNVECITYQYYFYNTANINIPKIVFPIEFVSSNKFIDVLLEVERKIEQGEEEEKIVAYLLKEIGSTMKRKLPKSLENAISNLIKSIVYYHQQNLNMIWLYIFMNYFRPFAERGYDVIIGNPPWVRWSNLPEAYREKIKSTLREEGVFSSDKNYGGVDLNICALIAYKASENFSKSKSIVFFILPQGILVNKSFEGFRKWRYGDTLCKPIKLYKPKKSFFKGEEPIMLMLSCSKQDTGYSE
ncbi:MAG: N-6 DNA methylase [Candidatus Anstonellales archaeon]